MPDKHILRPLILIGLLALTVPAWAQENGQPLPATERVTPPSASTNRPIASIPVDGRGGPTVDPTENVKALAAAGFGRQDDLRNMTERLLQTELKSVKEIGELKYQHALEMLKTAQDHIESEVKLRAELARENATAEKERLNAIRAVDVQAVADQARRTSEQATTLQAQTAQLAEALRTQTSRLADDLRTLVTTTATTQQANQQQKDSEVSKRLTTVEQALSEGRGKTQYQDPAQQQVIATLVAEVQKISQRQDANAGAGAGASATIVWIFGAIGALGVIAAMFFAFSRRESVRA